MAAYAGTTTVLWSFSIGSKRASLVKVEITNYNQSGIPFSPRKVGLGVIDAVFMGASPSLDDANAPFGLAYDPINEVCLLYSAADIPIDDDTNIHTTTGDFNLLVIGS